MNKEQFLKDSKKIYEYLNAQKNEVNKLVSALEDKQYDKLNLINDFAKSLNLKMSDDLRYALVTRLVNLRDDSLVQVLKKLGLDEKEVIDLQEKAYLFVKEFWHSKHKKTLDYIKDNNFLTPFYQAIFQGVYDVGIKMSSWQSSWTAHIINGINKELLTKFDGNEEKVFDYLESNSLFDLGHNSMTVDRSYSALVKKGNGYENQAYIKAFKKQTTEV
ncbi:MAG: CiaB protein, partial [Arcobacter sp.]